MDALSERTSLFPLASLLPIIILIEGFVSIGVEILTIRQLLPVAGGNVVVTSLVIGIFLLFLALGYRQGGALQNNLLKTLRINFMVAAIWLGVGLSYIFVSTFFTMIQKFFGTHIIYPLIAYLLLIIAPLIYLLGQTVPITMNLVKQNTSPGRIGGNTLGLSTIGSFLGAIFTTLVLMYFLGVAWTVCVNSFLLLLLFSLLSEDIQSFIIQLFFITIVALTIYTLNNSIENILFELTNNYANYQILDDSNAKLKKGEKILSVNSSSSSFINDHNEGFPYIEMIKKIIFKQLQLRNADILVLGAGGFTLSTESIYGNRLTYVDIDKQIKAVAIPRFVKQLNGNLVVDDARHYLHTSKKQYQAIITDAYSNFRSIPFHLLTREYMTEVKQKLSPNGIAIFNIIAKPALADPYSKRIDNTIRTVFQNCTVTPLSYQKEPTNILYVCTNTSNQNDHTIYSDNLNTSSTDYFDW